MKGIKLSDGTYMREMCILLSVSLFIPLIFKNNKFLENKNNICGRNYFFSVE